MTEISSNIPTNTPAFLSSVDSAAVQEMITEGGFSDIRDFIESVYDQLQEYGIYEGHMDEPHLFPENELVQDWDAQFSGKTILDPAETGWGFEEALDNAANKLANGSPPLSQQEVLNAVFAVRYGEGAPVDALTQTLADSLTELLMEELVAEYGDVEVFQPLLGDQKKIKQSVARKKSEILEGKIQQAVENGTITPSQAKQLLFAKNFPEFADPAIKNLLSQFDDMAMQELHETFGVPLDMNVSMDNSAFSRLLSDEFDIRTMANLEQMQSKYGLSENVMAKLRFMHYHPDADFPGKADLAGLGYLQNAESQALQSMSGEFGIPSNFAPSPNQALFNGIVKGFYRSEFQSQLKNYLQNDPNITAENYLQTKMMVEYTLDHPNAAGIPQHIKEITNQLSQAAWANVSEQYGILPGAMAVPVGPMSGGSVTPSENQYAHNLVNSLQSRLTIGTALALQMPDGSAKLTVLNFLKVVSEALSALKEFLYELESVDADIGKGQTRAKLDEKLTQLEYERTKMKEVQEKMKKMGVVATSLEAIMAVITVISLIPIVGPILASIMNAVMIALSQIIKVTVMEVIKAVLKGIVKGIVKAAVDAVKGVAEQLVKVKLLVNVTMRGAGEAIKHTAVSAVKGFFNAIRENMRAMVEALIKVLRMMIKLMQQMLTQAPSKSLQAMLKALQDVGKALIKGLENIGKGMKNMSAEKMKTAGENWVADPEAAQAAMNEIVDKIAISSMALEFAMAGVEAGVSAHHSQLQADVVMIEGRMDEVRELVESMIKIMQKAIDTLLDGLSKIGEWGADITDTLEGIFASQSAAITQLTQA